MDSDSSAPARSESGKNSFSLWREAVSSPSILTLIQDLRSALRDCTTVLDVGCGNSSPLRFLRGKRLTGIDGYAPAVTEAREKGTHHEFALGNVLQIAEVFKGRRFDACVALDVIEHLEKEDGWRMVQQMESLATKKVIIFTPNGFVAQKSKDGDLQEHLSGWSADEMRPKGYSVTGMYGPKPLRGEYHRIIRKPAVFWLVVSLLAHYLSTRSRPERSAAIFCVKTL